MKSIRTVALFSALSLAACNKPSSSSGSPFSTSGPASGAESNAAGPLDGWTDLSLASSGPIWKSWVVKAPPGATVKRSFDGLDIVKDKVGITVSFTALSLDSTAEDVRQGVNYDQKPAILQQTKELLEWSSSYKDASGPKTMYGFHLLVKTSGVTMGCKQAAGVPDRASLAPLEAACRTLAKR